MDQIAVGVGQDVALAPLDLLPCVIAPRPAAFRGLHTLAVDHSGAGRSLAADSFPPDQQQGMIEREPQAVVAPQVKPAPHRRDGRKARRQHPPRQPAAQQIQNRLDKAPERPLARTPPRRGRRKEALQHRPFGIGQIAWQSQVCTGILRPSGIGPHRRSPEVCCKTPESTTCASVKLTD